MSRITFTQDIYDILSERRQDECVQYAVFEPGSRHNDGPEVIAVISCRYVSGAMYELRAGEPDKVTNIPICSWYERCDRMEVARLLNVCPTLLQIRRIDWSILDMRYGQRRAA